MRRVTLYRAQFAPSAVFQSTPSMRRVTISAGGNVGSFAISIHTLHAEGDARRIAAALDFFAISIHTLHAEGDRRE